MKEFRNKSSLLLPFVTIIEAGNHIARIAAPDLREKYAVLLVEEVTKGFNRETPWRPLNVPNQADFIKWLAEFPNNVKKGKSHGLSLGDHTIIKTYQEQKMLLPQFEIEIWTLDAQLSSFNTT